MKHLLNWLLAIVMVLSKGTTASAQQTEKEGYHTRISVINLASDFTSNRLTWFKTEGSPFNKSKDFIIVSSATIMPPVDYSGPQIMTLVDPAMPDSKKGTSYTVIARATLPTCSQVIVAILPSEKFSPAGAPRYRCIALDAATTGFPAGSRRFCNFTPHPIRGIIGEIPFKPMAKNNKTFKITSGNSKVVSPLDPNAPSGSKMQAYIEYYDATSSQWKRIASARWFHLPSKRKLIFIFRHSGSTTPSIKIFPQRV